MSRTITLTLTEEEAQWLATAVTVLRRVLQDFPSKGANLPDYCDEGLAVLDRITEILPEGRYL